MRRARDPRVPSQRNWGARSAELEVARIRALLAGPPGFLHGKDFDEIRQLINEPDVPDGTLEQALIDEGLEVED